MQEMLLILVLCSLALALPGVLLVLRRMAMVTDALSHSVLLGIVLAYFCTKDISSPYLLIGAALFGVLSVYCIELLISSRLLKSDAATGLVFPLFFSIAVILISKYANTAQLDTDCVLMGELVFAPLKRVEVWGISMPKAALQLGIMLCINLLFIIIFYKELKLSCFDEEAAILSGFSLPFLYYGLTTISALNAVVAFDVVGAVLVIAFFVTPAASALLISKRLWSSFLIAAAYGIGNSLTAYLIAVHYNLSLSGLAATVAGLSYGLTFLFCPEGYVAGVLRRREAKREYALQLMLLHIYAHSGTAGQFEELGRNNIAKHLNWSVRDLNKRVKALIKSGFVHADELSDCYLLTDSGKTTCRAIRKAYGLVER